MEYQWYIKLHRKILENKVFYKPNYLAVFMEILLNVYHSPYKKAIRGDIVDLSPGEGVFFQNEISDKFNISLWTVSNILKFLKTENIIEIKPTTKYSIIKLNNWSKYQTSEKETENELKTEWKPTENELKHYKNVKNKKNVKNGISKDIETEVSEIKEISIISEDQKETNKKEVYWNEEINDIIKAIKEKHGIVDWPIQEQRNFWNLLAKKIKTIDGFNWDFYSFIKTIIEKSDSYRIGKTTSPKKIYYNLSELIANIRGNIEKNKSKMIVNHPASYFN